MKYKLPLPISERQRMAILYRSGLSTHKLAPMFSRSPSSIARILTKHSVKLRPPYRWKPLSKYERDEIKQMKYDGIKASLIANRYRITKSTVWSVSSEIYYQSWA